MLGLANRARLKSDLETGIAHSETHRVHINVIVHLGASAFLRFQAFGSERPTCVFIDHKWNVDFDLFSSSVSNILRKGWKAGMAVDCAFGEEFRLRERIVGDRVIDDDFWDGEFLAAEAGES